MNAPPDAQKQLRWSVYLLLAALSLGSMVGRIMAVNSVDLIGLEAYLHRQYEEGKRKAHEWQKQRPFLSSNDRSRWCTIRALVELGTYEIDEITLQPNWDTIDRVMHKNRQGEPRLYSSKPPLLPTILAGEYWLIHKLTGADMGKMEDAYDVGRAILLTANVLPMLLYFLALGSLAERFGTTDWGRMFMLGAAAFGTFLSTFAVTLNNHIPAAVSVALALWAAVPLCLGERRCWWRFALAGLFAAFAAANELPALSFLALLGAVLLWKAPARTLAFFVPPAAVVAAAFFGTNYIAHESWRPPYAHRSAADPEDNWYDYEYEYTDQSGKKRKLVSYWRDENRVGLDRGEPSRAVYALHVTVGHHGIFSLTPVWLLSVAGIAVMLVRGPPPQRVLGGGVALLSAVCLVFYVVIRPEIDRNYGGVTSGFRWMFWFAPLWLVCLLPVADWLSQRRWGRLLGLLLLGASVLSASYPTWNPWTHPWIYEYMKHMGFELP